MYFKFYSEKLLSARELGTLSTVIVARWNGHVLGETSSVAGSRHGTQTARRSSLRGGGRFVEGLPATRSFRNRRAIARRTRVSEFPVVACDKTHARVRYIYRLFASPRQTETDDFKCYVNGCTKSFSSMAVYNAHYNSNHRYTCVYCRKQLQSAHLLDLHLSETHDNFFLVSSAKKPMVRRFSYTRIPNSQYEIYFWREFYSSGV